MPPALPPSHRDLRLMTTCCVALVDTRPLLDGAHQTPPQITTSVCKRAPEYAPEYENNSRNPEREVVRTSLSCPAPARCPAQDELLSRPIAIDIAGDPASQPDSRGPDHPSPRVRVPAGSGGTVHPGRPTFHDPRPMA
ncbi:hypothetical protein L226DRAFT_533423 [Lentinus tigrinus ALCF2SS1-7]|uniref:uncharacterized protein n=1 Tax=Lentinus tigrinus ALCF2SS1-7 TaxID=1328758 RepID=UPI0011661841|nr:hypothetical protein L226DRAFT_533423 [Lentinus tigrinus ALCF2SS1-7]